MASDLTPRPGQELFRRLLLAADVVIERSRHRALEQMGVDPVGIIEAGPQVWLSITAQRRGAQVRHRVAFGDDAAATGGPVGWVGGEPRFVVDAIADPLTGLTAALATTELLESGGGWLADVTLANGAIGRRWLDCPGQAIRTSEVLNETGCADAVGTRAADRREGTWARVASPARADARPRPADAAGSRPPYR